jgi:hypothetical protein
MCIQKGLTMKPLIYLLLATLFLTSCQSQAEIDGNTDNTPKWSLTDDLTPRDRYLSTRILTDPSGQKFLIVKSGNGLVMMHYKDNSPFALEAK